MYVGPDDVGLPGIFLYKDLPTEAGLCLEKTLKKITPQVRWGWGGASDGRVVGSPWWWGCAGF